ncbi:hypothetical protein HGA91_05345 [candidate division WWE3 bacterium]|nr:hypothetical protein [candidate division WWE3 bacterium]
MDEILVRQRIRRLCEHYQNGEIPKLHQHEVNPGLNKSDRLNYLFFTLPVAINYQRSSPALWKAALDTYEDKQTTYLFYPEKVVQVTDDQLRKDLCKNKLALQPNRHTLIWRKLTNSFNKNYHNDPRFILQLNTFNISQILNYITIEQKNQFPYLCGAKMSNYWLYILHQFTDAPFTGLEHISIIPDTHVMQSSVRLGLVPLNSSPEQTAQAWFFILKNSEIRPIDMHPILWNWSRNNFIPEV